MDSTEEITRQAKIDQLQRLGEIALQNYGLANAALTFISDTANTVFRVDTPQQQYTLRIDPFPPDPELLPMLEAELFWLAALRTDTALNVPEPVSAQDGALVQVVSTPELPEGHPVTLLKWLPGTLVDEQPTPDILRQMGAFMAQLHHHAEQFTFPEGIIRTHTPWDKLAYWGNPENDTTKTITPEQRALCSRAAERLLTEIEQIGTQVEYGLIHADLHLANCLLHKGKLGVIDFADCRFASFFYDMAVPLTYLDERQDYAELKAAFFEGYTSQRNLPNGCKAAVQTFMVARALDIIEWIHFDWPHPEHYPFGPGLLAEALRRIQAYLRS
jgi:Ser/Thr protein kinase RdoA (MazF antagonist)